MSHYGHDERCFFQKLPPIAMLDTDENVIDGLKSTVCLFQGTNIVMGGGGEEVAVYMQVKPLKIFTQN